MKKRKPTQKTNRVLFKTKSNDLRKIQRKRKRISLRGKFNIRRILIYSLVATIIFGAIYLLISNSGKKTDTGITVSSYVLGLDDVPTYPNSEFLYADKMDDQVVKDMLANGKSAYKIVDRSKFSDVKIFYANELTSKGWNLVLDIEIGQEDKKYGQYWTNEEVGLRIYSKFNDIWYEYITIEEAQNGLSNRVSNEIEIDMLLAGSDFQDLLPDYPWQIKIPKEYLIRYEVSEFEDLRAVNFQRISSGSYITIYPIGYWGSKALDYQLDDYVDILSSGSEKWGVRNTYITTFRGTSTISGIISSGQYSRDILMLKNGKNFVTYVLSTQDKSDPLYQYLIDNIKYLGEDES